MTPKGTTNTPAEKIAAQGPCGICGGQYAAHRRIDTQLGRAVAGEPLHEIAADWGMTTVEMIAEWQALIDLLHDRRPTGDHK